VFNLVEVSLSKNKRMVHTVLNRCTGGKVMACLGGNLPGLIIEVDQCTVDESFSGANLHLCS